MLNEIADLDLHDFALQHVRLHRLLLKSLNSGGSWNILLDTLRSSYNILCKDDIFHKIESSSNPALVLYHELEQRFATVYHLRCFLRESNLLNSLALISEPEPLRIVRQPGREDQLFTVDDGGRLVIECVGEGLPPPTYQWHLENPELPGETNPTLTISNFQLENCGEYYCVVTHVVDDEVISIVSNRIRAELKPIIPQFLEDGDLPREKIVPAGCQFRISVSVMARPRPTFVWLKNNIVLEGLNSNVLEFDCVQPEDQGKYRCLIRNMAGELSSKKCTINVILSPEQSLPNNAASYKIALLIGNSAYSTIGKLCTPANDVVSISQKLRQIGFYVIELLNLSSTEMRGAIKWFYRHLPANAYAFFYYAGHGIMTGHTRYRYMVPVDASESFKLSDCYADEELIKRIMSTQIKLFVMVLDMCSKIPERFKKEVDEKIFTYKRNTNITLIRLNSASDYMKAYEISNEECKNGLYTHCLAKYLTQDYPISHIDRLVQEEFEQHSRKKLQIPSFTSSGDGRSLKLTDPAVYFGEITEIDREMMRWNVLKTREELKFDRVKVYTSVNLSFHKGCFKNALDFVFPVDLNQWVITAEVSHECLTNYEWNESKTGEKMLTIFDLQKATSSISITIKLSTKCCRNFKESFELVDYCDVDLDYLAIVDKKLGL